MSLYLHCTAYFAQKTNFSFSIPMPHNQQTSRYVENFIFNIIIEQTYWRNAHMSNLPIILHSSYTTHISTTAISYRSRYYTAHYTYLYYVRSKCSEAVLCNVSTAEPPRRHCAIFAFRNFAQLYIRVNNKTTGRNTSIGTAYSNLYFIQMIVYAAWNWFLLI